MADLVKRVDPEHSTRIQKLGPGQTVSMFVSYFSFDFFCGVWTLTSV